MVKFDTKLEIKKSSGICQEIAETFPNVIDQMLEQSEFSGEENAIGIFRWKGELRHTGQIEGQSTFLTKSMSSSNINEIRVEVMDTTDIRDSNEFLDRVRDLIILHTHPGGDPSPSPKDLTYIINQAESIALMKSEFASFMGKLPQPTGLFAVSRIGDKDVITGFRVMENDLSMQEIEVFKDLAKSVELKALPRFLKSEEEKISRQEELDRAYQKLITMATEGDEIRGPILERCHAVIER